MTNKEINIAIAKACGIEDVDQWGPIYKTPSGWMRDRPDYANDLNAMHEAEKALINRNLYQDYWPTLEHITGSSRLAHATARQKAKAFLKTLNLWEQ